MESEQMAVLPRVVQIVSSLGIVYHVTGSIASSIHGIPRFTQDIDLVVSIEHEDTILRKLDWFRLGREVSDRQWSDVLGVLEVQAAALDYDYLRFWAAEVGTRDLLERALAAAGAGG